MIESNQGFDDSTNWISPDRVLNVSIKNLECEKNESERQNGCECRSDLYKLHFKNRL